MIRQCTVTILLSLTTVAWAAEPLPDKVDYNRDTVSYTHLTLPTKRIV